MDRAANGDFSNTERSVLSGKALLWLIWHEKKIMGCGVTEIRTADRGKFCVIVACGCEGIDGGWPPLIGVIERYARDEGCTSMEITGRNGWSRVLQDYRVTSVVLTKELN